MKEETAMTTYEQLNVCDLSKTSQEQKHVYDDPSTRYAIPDEINVGQDISDPYNQSVPERKGRSSFASRPWICVVILAILLCLALACIVYLVGSRAKIASDQDLVVEQCSFGTKRATIAITSETTSTETITTSMEMTSSSTNKTSSTAETTSPETITTSLEMTSSSIETTSPTAGCCTIGTMHLNLSTSTNSALIPGIMIETESTGTSSNCDVPVVVRATFERIGGQGGCRTCSLCKRTMLQVDLYLSDSRGGFLFNVGDSITNNGYGGDGGTQTNDAEVQGTGQGPSVKWYGNDYCQPTGVSGSLAMSTKNRLRLLIGNQFVRVITDGMTVNEACDRCLFALNGQAEVEGAVNEDVYVAFNKVVQKYSGRTGYGVCGADLSWVCGCLP